MGAVATHTRPPFYSFRDSRGLEGKPEVRRSDCPGTRVASVRGSSALTLPGGTGAPLAAPHSSFAQSRTGSSRLRGGGRELAARTVRCAPALRKAPPTAPSGAQGPQEATAGDQPARHTAQQPGQLRALNHARILKLREVKKLAQGHTASKRLAGPGLRTHLVRSPPYTVRPAAAAETAAQCAGASGAGCAGRRRGRQPAGRRTKPPFFPRAPPSAPSPL